MGRKIAHFFLLIRVSLFRNAVENKCFFILCFESIFQKIWFLILWFESVNQKNCFLVHFLKQKQEKWSKCFESSVSLPISGVWWIKCEVISLLPRLALKKDSYLPSSSRRLFLSVIISGAGKLMHQYLIRVHNTVEN